MPPHGYFHMMAYNFPTSQHKLNEPVLSCLRPNYWTLHCIMCFFWKHVFNIHCDIIRKNTIQCVEVKDILLLDHIRNRLLKRVLVYARRRCYMDHMQTILRNMLLVVLEDLVVRYNVSLHWNCWYYCFLHSLPSIWQV